MAYEYYNANARGKIENDCFIRSLSCATDRSWDYTYDMISNIARIEGTMMDDKNFVIEYLDTMFDRMPEFYGTIAEASEYYKDNVILVTTLGHIVCSKYGTVYDTWNSIDREVEYIWLVK